MDTTIVHWGDIGYTRQDNASYKSISGFYYIGYSGKENGNTTAGTFGRWSLCAALGGHARLRGWKVKLIPGNAKLISGPRFSGLGFGVEGVV